MIATVNDPLAGNILANYWPRLSLLQHADWDTHLFEPNPIIYSSTNDGFDSLTAYPLMQDYLLPVCKPFGIDLIDDDLFRPSFAIKDCDILESFNTAKMKLTALLAGMPQMQGDDIQEKVDLLLGSPTVTSLRCVVEVGIYMSSNNLKGIDDFIQWIFEKVPLTVLNFVLRNPTPTIRTFAESVLKVATDMENVEMVKNLLRHAHLKKLLKSSGKLLIRAVQRSNNELVRSLIDAGARADLKWQDLLGLRVPLLEAKTVEIARTLVRAGADINAFGNARFSHSWHIGFDASLTALCVAVGNDDVKLARYLIDAGADVNLRHPRFDSPLEMAARGTGRELVELLLEHHADANRVPGALQRAALLGNLDHVRLLVEAGAAVNAPVKIPALHAASIHGHFEVMTFLLNHGANVNTPSDSRTLLTTAVENDDVKMVDFLLNAGADVNMPSFTYHGCSVLEMALSRSAKSEIVNLLIAKGARDPFLTLNSHHKILFYDAVYSQDFDRVQFLINLGLQIDLQIIEYLPRPFSGNAPKHATILHLALYGKEGWKRKVDVEFFRFLLAKMTDLNAHIKDSDLSSLLVQACRTHSIELVEMFIDAGADINRCNDRGNYPLLGAMYPKFLVPAPREEFDPESQGQEIPELVRFLLRKGADVNAINEDGKYYTTALQASLWQKDTNLTYFLLANGATINAPIALYGCSELSYAAQMGNIQLVRDLLDRGADVNAPGQRTALQAAAELYEADMDMVELLLERGADVNAPGDTTALQAAAWRENMAFVQLLLEKGADVNAPGDSTALQAAAWRGNMAIVQLLLEKKADVNAPGRNSALQLAIESGNFQLVLLLFETGANVNAQNLGNDKFPRTALETAAKCGRLDILHVLLKAGADMHLPPEERYVRAANFARENDHIVIAEILEEWDEGEDAQGNLTDWIRNSKRQKRDEDSNQNRIEELDDEVKDNFMIRPPIFF